MPFFSRFKNKGAQPASKGRNEANGVNGMHTGPQRPRWQSTWSSKEVVPEEVEELIHTCTAEMKSRAEALDAPFFLLPFRPATDSSGARAFIRNFYKSNAEGSHHFRGSNLRQELRLTEPVVLCSIIKWCWSRMPDGVVSWPIYEGFQIGEQESGLARNAFDTFIPIGAESTARKNIIVDFFDLIAAVAAHGKMNGLGGRKLSRLAGWWAFDHSDDGKGFEGGYKSWSNAADATSHLFFAYLRSLSPEVDHSKSLIERIPRSLQALLASTEYPPDTPSLMRRSTPRVVMLVDAVSPTPFALLRRAKKFEYRDRDRVLREYSAFEDPIDALTEECKRVLYAISSNNSSVARSKNGNLAKSDESWSAFSNMGFSDLDPKALQKTPDTANGTVGKPLTSGLRSEPRSRNADHGRPTTPSWADFLDSGFAEDDKNKTSTALLLPREQMLPPIGSRPQTQTYAGEGDENLAPGELAAITAVDLDDAFWWVWMISLASEEPAERKAVFGRCAVIETSIMHGRWLIMEEQVKGASPDPENGAYIAPKKNFLSTFTRGRLGRKKSTGKKPPPTPEKDYGRAASATPSKHSLAPDQQSKIRQAAAALKRQDTREDDLSTRRGRYEEANSTKTNSVLTMGLQNDAGPAMKWMGAYDKHTLRAQYLGDNYAGTGQSREELAGLPSSTNGHSEVPSTTASPAPMLSPDVANFAPDSSTRDLRALPNEGQASAGAQWPQETQLPPQMPPSPLEINTIPHEAKETQRVAESVPVPDAAPSSAMEKELAVDSPHSSARNRLGRKPLPQAHPALRQESRWEPVSPQTPTSPTQSIAALAAQRAMETSPESNKSGHGKLQKQSNAGTSSGLKKMFGRKKDNPNRQSVDVMNNGSGLAPPDQGPMRRISLMRKKTSPAPTPKASQVDVSEHHDASELEAEPVMSSSHGRFEDSTTAISTTDSQDQRQADQEFARFDQGPVDMPATTPLSETEPEIVAPQAQRTFNTRFASQIAPQRESENEPDFATPMEQPQSQPQPQPPPQHERDADAQSEMTMEEQPDPKDRWAMIRENAARRAARASERPSEEQSAQSRPSQSQRTEDGETSGEESKFEVK
ncbi:multicopy suppressor of a budding defect [Vermiconidia calcicola]|uniref:Multicopy suppressor of a budding defect n=1 Tax=Vermiconidia calcicola TaxID=1690605 RepID=A0ACC3NGN2_9PEZI|nr:multicopy suppressor of a budding defect [Vermiconidia calcicola]